MDEAAFWSDKRARFDLLGARLDATAVVIAPLSNPLSLEAEVPQAANEARGYLTLSANSTSFECRSAKLWRIQYTRTQMSEGK